MVVWMPKRRERWLHRDEVKTEPLSEVISSGRPNFEIHEVIRADTQDSVVASGNGTASGHLVERSITVKM